MMKHAAGAADTWRTSAATGDEARKIGPVVETWFGLFSSVDFVAQENR
jgi:hypothetical protein